MPSNNCRICKKPLSEVTSVKLGIGPVCRAREALEPELDFFPHADFIFQAITDDYIYIKDAGGSSRSITNDTEYVLLRLTQEFGELGKRRVFYMDTLGQIDEILVNNTGRFSGFKAGHKGLQL